ncbi:MAG: hypothetical protein ABWJ99_04625 [Caldimicrobium sp.]
MQLTFPTDFGEELRKHIAGLGQVLFDFLSIRVLEIVFPSHTVVIAFDGYL